MEFTVRVVKNGFTVKFRGVAGVYIADSGYAVTAIINDLIAKDADVKANNKSIEDIRMEAN